jgi:hypothetical protein
MKLPEKQPMVMNPGGMTERKIQKVLVSLNSGLKD